jgi:hypothetical protein
MLAHQRVLDGFCVLLRSSSMRLIIFLLIALAIGKVGTQAYIRQQSATATIINAYREHALAACRQSGLVPAHSNYNGQVSTGSDSNHNIELIIGRKELDVRLWQTSHRDWSTKYRDPFLIIKSGAAGATSACEYDINRGTVHASRDRNRVANAPTRSTTN